MKLITHFLVFSTLALLNASVFASDNTASSNDVTNDMPKQISSRIPSETVIATWSAKPEIEMTMAQAQTRLNESRYTDATGNERQQVNQYIHYQKQKIDTLSASAQTQLLVLEAKVLQGTHQFNQAEALLTGMNMHRYAPALLLLADIKIQQGEAEVAKNHCQQLVGKTSYLLAFTCMLNAEFALNTNEATYQKLLSLRHLAKKSGAKKANTDERLWYYETLAAMAFTLNKPEATISHLAKLDSQKLPVSALLLWSDAKLELVKPQDIIDKFTAIQTASRRIRNRTGNSTDNNFDDGLLLRWVKAERQLSLHDTEIQKQLADRMALRTWREDVSHAAQVASYFLDIDYKPAIALKFARINWQAAQTQSDARLLTRAESAVAASSTLN